MERAQVVGLRGLLNLARSLRAPLRPVVLRRLGKTEHPVKYPVEDRRVNEKENHQTELREEGLDQPNSQDQGNQWDQQNDNSGFECQGVSNAHIPGPIRNADAPLKRLKQPV